MKGFVIVVSTMGVVVLGLTIFSRVKYRRSLMATLVEWYLKITEKEYPDALVVEGLKDLPKINCAPYRLPRFASGAKEYNYRGMQTFIFGNEGGDTAVVYLHGGGYVRQPRSWHIRFLKKLGKSVNATVIAPIYPKAPKNTCEDVYPLMYDFYLEIRKSYRKIVLAGDSSGGGLALGFAEYLLKKGTSLPERVILLSPWLDVSLSNPTISIYEKVDPMLSSSNERIWGKAWAGALPVEDYKVSPLNGVVKGLCPITLLVGTRELLYPDALKLKAKVEDVGGELVLIVGNGLNHVYPIYPIPEASKAFKEICDAINAV